MREGDLDAKGAKGVDDTHPLLSLCAGEEPFEDIVLDGEVAPFSVECGSKRDDELDGVAPNEGELDPSCEQIEVHDAAQVPRRR